MSTNQKVAFITGSTRGIGQAIAQKLSKNGYNVCITGKTIETHKKSPNTIYSVAKHICDNGGNAHAIQIDVRDEDSVQNALDECRIIDFPLTFVVSNRAVSISWKSQK